ncbi:YraN family protein [Pedobacter sp. Du54]|uniref:YraN family protein n=1 Tax=Pedobacter anseongensis TaxID=3133439 RepID=UPI0030A42AEC
MAQHNDLGKRGEQLAKQFLIQKGYEILDENWVYERAEIDLIAYVNKVIVFIEVKARSSTGFGLPEDFVNIVKQQHMANAADAYLEIMNHDGEVRFDIVSVLFNPNNQTIKHIEDAFWP